MSPADRRQVILARLIAASAQLQAAHADAKAAGLSDTTRMIDAAGAQIAMAISQAQREQERVRA